MQATFYFYSFVILSYTFPLALQPTNRSFKHSVRTVPRSSSDILLLSWRGSPLEMSKEQVPCEIFNGIWNNGGRDSGTVDLNGLLPRNGSGNIRPGRCIWSLNAKKCIISPGGSSVMQVYFVWERDRNE